MARETKIAALHRTMNEEYRNLFGEAFKEKFGTEIETTWNFFADTLVSTKPGGADFTQAEKDFMDAFQAGYTAAWGLVRE